MIYTTLSASLLTSLVLLVTVQGVPIEEECHVDLFTRLPKNIKPSHYALNMRPNLDDAMFEGRVIIDLNVSDESVADRIVLHADESLEVLNVDFVTTTTSVNQLATADIKNVCRDYDNSLLVVELDANLNSAGGQLAITFSGPIRDDTQGFYMSAYQDHDETTTKYMAATKFEATHARKAFPCFDEPEFKATFDLTIEHEPHLQAIASTPVVRVQQQDNIHIVQFERTPKMSTFLLAFAVGEFEHLTSRSVSGVTLGIYTSSAGRKHLAEYALDKIVQIYTELNKYFQPPTQQQLKKIDFLAVNELDAATGSWGLVSVPENTLLVPKLADNEKSADQLIFLLQTITRELVHQWVGNSVTMKWWDDVWLNKGLAAWLTLIIEDKAYPELQNDLSHLIDAQVMSQIYDSDWQKSHPLKSTKNLVNAQQIENSIDLLTYYKSSSLFRMLNDYLGPAQFELAIKKYLSANALSSTSAEQLYDSLEQTTGLEVADMMRTWTEQAGFPLVSVSLASDGSALHVQQSRQKSRNSAPVAGAESQLWSIPISIEVSSGLDKSAEVRYVLTKSSDIIKLPTWFDANNPRHYVKVNKNFAGFFMTHYDNAKLFNALESPVRQKLISPADRLNVLSDTHALFKARKVSGEQMEQTLSWFENENNDVVIDMLARVIMHLEKFHPKQDSSEPRINVLLKYVQQTGNLNHVSSDNLLRKRTRARVLSALVSMNHHETIDSLLEVFNECTSGKRQMQFLQHPISAAVAKAGSSSQKEQLAEMNAEQN